jgi:3D (Asp-Asp-Asp) domain-containing protein
MRYTVSEVLEQNGVVVGPYDDVSVELGSKLQKKMINDIYIRRAVPLTIVADGKAQMVYSSKNTVFEALKGSHLSFGLYDKVVGAKLPDSIYDGMRFSLVRVENRLVSERTQVPYTTIKRESKELAVGEEKVVKKGTEGIVEKTFQILQENGKEIARHLVKECLIAAPVDKIVEYGSNNSHRTSRGGVIRYRKVLKMRATAYSSSFEDCGKHPDHPEYGITFTGMKVAKGVVAVDPRVIPLGSRLYVEIAGNTPDYGFAIAADTGGLVKGDIIDLYFDQKETVSKWGVKSAKVYILDK